MHSARNRGLAIRYFCQTTKEDDLASRTRSHAPLSFKSESLGRERVKPVVEMQLTALGLLRSCPTSQSVAKRRVLFVSLGPRLFP
jgi:hypothetical protein